MVVKMRITRKQLRKLINESIYGGSNYPARVPNPMDHVSPEVRKKLEPLTTSSSIPHQRQGYELATTLQPDMTVFPNDGDPYTRKPYEGDDYLADLGYSDRTRYFQIKLKNAYDAVEAENISLGLGGVNLGGLGRRNDPDFKRKEQLSKDVQDAYMAAIDHSKQLASERGLKDWAKVFHTTFDQFIPNDLYYKK